MKKFICRYGHIFAAFALMFTAYGSSRCCDWLLHQPEMPESAKKYRRL